jgi:uncharacterized membrane protein
MIDIIFYGLAALTLPVGAIILAHYAIWSLDRDLEQCRRQRSADSR